MGMKLTAAQFDREAGYRFSKAVMGALQEKGLITQRSIDGLNQFWRRNSRPYGLDIPMLSRINAPEIACYSVLSEVICHTDKGIDTTTLRKDG